MLNPAAEFDYNPRVRELFADLRHAGSLSAAAPQVVSVSAGARTQGAYVQWQIEMCATYIGMVRYHAYGCPHFLAACELLARWQEGRACREMGDWRWQAAAIELALPASKRSRLLLLDEVSTALLSMITQAQR